MKIKYFALSISLLGLAACSGGNGGGTFVDPVDRNTMEKAIATHFDGTCVERDQNAFVCGSYGDEPVGSAGLPEIVFVLLPGDDGALGVANLFLRHSYLENADTYSMLKRFGFSKDDVLEVIEAGDPLDRNGFRLSRLDSDTVFIAASSLINLD